MSEAGTKRVRVCAHAPRNASVKLASLWWLQSCDLGVAQLRRLSYRCGPIRHILVDLLPVGPLSKTSANIKRDKREYQNGLH